MILRPPSLDRRRFALGAAALAAGATLGARPGFVARANAAAPAPIVEITPPVVRDPASYEVYIPTACKDGPFFIYTCEFDAAWAVLATFGIDAPLEEQLDAIEIDTRLEPYYQETADGFLIYGGDITSKYSGDYRGNFLARTTSGGFRPVFKRWNLLATRVDDRKGIERYLRRGRLIWIKTTVDFKDWVPATWVTPEGETLPVVLGNDHAMVVIGFDQDVVVIRDVLGPTDTNWERPYEFEVPWDRFLACWAAQGSDGLAVGKRDAD